MFGFARKTREARRATKQDAWINVAGSFATRRCTLLDISKRGAKLRVDDPSFLPGQFSLKMSPADRTGRMCRVVWRKGLLCGVEFLT